MKLSPIQIRNGSKTFSTKQAIYKSIYSVFSEALIDFICILRNRNSEKNVDTLSRKISRKNKELYMENSHSEKYNFV